MTDIFQRKGLFLLFSLIMLPGASFGQHGRESSKGASCAPLENRFDSLLAGLSHQSVFAQRSSLLRFIESVPDDPENCVTRSAEEKLVTVEQPMFQLKINSALILPDWLYQCYEIDRKTQQCRGASPYADDIPHMPDEKLISPHALPPPHQNVTIAIPPGIACAVETISVFELQDPRHRMQPRIIATSGAPFYLDSLRQMKYPVLIAAIRCKDNLRFRKVAWLLK